MNFFFLCVTNLVKSEWLLEWTCSLFFFLVPWIRANQHYNSIRHLCSSLSPASSREENLLRRILDLSHSIQASCCNISIITFCHPQGKTGWNGSSTCSAPSFNSMHSQADSCSSLDVVHPSILLSSLWVFFSSSIIFMHNAFWYGQHMIMSVIIPQLICLYLLVFPQNISHSLYIQITKVSMLCLSAVWKSTSLHHRRARNKQSISQLSSSNALLFVWRQGSFSFY